MLTKFIKALWALIWGFILVNVSCLLVVPLLLRWAASHKFRQRLEPTIGRVRISIVDWTRTLTIGVPAIACVQSLGIILTDLDLVSRLLPAAHEYFSHVSADLLTYLAQLLTWSPWLLGLALVVLAPIGEEVLFRGYLPRILHRQLGAASAVVLSNVLFGALHGGVLAAAAFAVILSLLRIRAGSLLPGILLHALNNGIAFLLILKYGIAVETDLRLSSAEFSMRIGIVLLCAPAVYVLVRDTWSQLPAFHDDVARRWKAQNVVVKEDRKSKWTWYMAAPMSGSIAAPQKS